MTDNELLLAISSMMDEKFKANLAPLEKRLTKIELALENDILPQLQNIGACYTSTYERYQNNSDKIEAVFEDIELVKNVLMEHSEKLQKIS